MGGHHHKNINSTHVDEEIKILIKLHKIIHGK